MTRGKVQAAMGPFLFVVKIKGRHKRIVGPFETRGQASAWAAGLMDESWTVVEMVWP